MTFPTLTERERAEVAAMAAALEVLGRDLASDAKEHGGRYVLFGSAARGELLFGSYVDIMANFPADRDWDAVASHRTGPTRSGCHPT